MAEPLNDVTATISGPGPDQRLHQLPFGLFNVGAAAVPPADEEPAATLRQGTPPPEGSAASLTATAGTPLENLHKMAARAANPCATACDGHPLVRNPFCGHPS